MVAKQSFVFSTDSYDENSIKAQERLRTGVSEKLTIDSPATKKSLYMKLFLQNDQNKQQFRELLLKFWRSKEAMPRLKKCTKFILFVKGSVYELSVNDADVQY